ncbi:pyrroline-5-carboxylate reductase [Paucibacter oligotrophus]|uniref:Pyrroline-5-carboxylate reductase n=1 Tax=Roseateles oligotrophus TaxID=1769250 RepID=A0A840LHB3_9BURK|nr:pyrroline-5-carboxylate reductase [Roseateles oligotrophus]MBB4846002.1 pyrroline-5-carboxylate reductase [Roseateles oligotrophus]
MSHTSIAFIGGGNMASAIVGGLLRAGRAPQQILVVEPFDEARARLSQDLGVRVFARPEAALGEAGLVVWAVKPQFFTDAAAPCAPWVGQALQLSVMAGIRSDAIARLSGTERVVRSMPNTPALIGQGITGLFGRAAVSEADKQWVEEVLAPTGRSLWVGKEADLDAVTAVSGSGPAYFFYVVEAMMAAAVEMGLTAEQGRLLALATCSGAAELALQSVEDPSVLRARVTSKGGTTQAAISSLEADQVAASMRRAVLAAQRRARELGDEFGA